MFKITKKSLVGKGTILAAFIVLMNSFTIVDAGKVKVESLFGTVKQEVLTEGLHFPVNPLSKFDTYDVRNAKYEVMGLDIPTQDRFNSTGNVTVLYRIQGNMAPFIKQNYGTAEEYVNKTLRQHLRAIIRDEGRKLSDSRSLADSTSVSMMQENTTARLLTKLSGTGLDVQEALIQDIDFDPRIKKQILDTQIRIQQEEAKLSEERQAQTDARIALEKAKGVADAKEKQADAEKYRLEKIAEGQKNAAIARATGEAEGIKLIADANIKLSESLTDVILEKMDKDNLKVLYSKSRGEVPAMVVGDTDLRALGIPVAVQDALK